MDKVTFAKELQHEAATTRHFLERLPDDKFVFKPHVRSTPAGELATHIVQCVGWTPRIFGADEFNFDPVTLARPRAHSSSELLGLFDHTVGEALNILHNAAEGSLAQPWTFKVMGKARFQRPRAIVFRDFVLSHLIHHRGQFSVYLRLLDIPVPGAYGPSADES